MSEDYVIEWDKNFADDLNVVASVFLSHNPTLWPTIFSQLSTQPEIFEDEDEDEYGLQDVLDCSGGDLGNNDLAQAFLQVLRGEGFIHLVDWKGEDEEGELANFAADRFYELTKNLTDSEELRNLLVEITKRMKSPMSVKPGTVTLTRSLNASRPNSIRGASRFLI